MKILVLGNGGREHALAWRLTQSPHVGTVYVAPGNAGTDRCDRVRNLPLDPVRQIPELIDFARREQIGLTVVGPEAPLAAGVVDQFRAAGLRIFGPTKAAAQLEASKDFAKQFMARHQIPTAAYQTFTVAEEARAYVDARVAEIGLPIVIKADGLAAGKGVVVAETLADAHAAIDSMLLDNRFGGAGAKVVIEDFLQGEEASFIVVCDGKDAVALATSQDHKRVGDGDQGPNTGGMGAYSPAPVVTPNVHALVMREIIRPLLNGMAAEGMPYTGFLYAGLMIDSHGNPRVVEFNCRMGDPETQPIMLRMRGDLLELLQAAVDTRLHEPNLLPETFWDPRPAVGIVAASAGYPESARVGDEITHLPDNQDDAIVFHAGTALADGRLLTSGGRVLCATALGFSLREAQARAYSLMDGVAFEGMHYRRDIGWRALK